MTHHTDAERALANLRHLYTQMVFGTVSNTDQAKRIAEGLLSPAIAKLEQAASRDPAAPVPQGWKLVPVELLKRIQESLGSFVSDQGWSQSNMDTADALDGLLAAAAPQPPGAAPVVLPEYGIDTANHAGIRVRGYTEQQVLELLAAPEAELIAWYVTGCNTLLDEHDAKAEAKRCGGSAKAVPLYAAARHTHNTRNNT